MKRTVTVTQDDLDKGTPGASCYCPVSRAARRDLTDLLYPEDAGRYQVVTDSEALHLRTGREKYVRACLPRDVQTAIRAIDNGRLVQPFTFEIEIETGA